MPLSTPLAACADIRATLLLWTPLPSPHNDWAEGLPPSEQAGDLTVRRFGEVTRAAPNASAVERSHRPEHRHFAALGFPLALGCGSTDAASNVHRSGSGDWTPSWVRSGFALQTKGVRNRFLEFLFSERQATQKTLLTASSLPSPGVSPSRRTRRGAGSCRGG